MNKVIIALVFLSVFGLTSVALAKENNSDNRPDKDTVTSSTTLPDKDLDKKVKDIIEEKASSSDGVKNKVEQLEKRSKLKTFLIGTDYKTLGALRSEVVQTRNDIDKINRMVNDLASSTEKDNLLSQLNTLEKTQTDLEQIIKNNESKFSLFGWFVKMFQK